MIDSSRFLRETARSPNHFLVFATQNRHRKYEVGWVALLVGLLVHGCISNAIRARKKDIAVYEHIIADCTRDRSTFPFRF